MLIFFIIFFTIILLEVLIIAILTSNIVFNIEECELYSKDVLKKIRPEKIKLSIQIYIFKFIKILNIKIYKNYFEIFGIKINFQKIYKFKDKDEVYIKFYELFKLLKENSQEISLSNLNPKIKSFKMKLKFSTENAIITSITTIGLSTVIAFILEKYMYKFDKKNYEYKIIPSYINTNVFRLELNTKINFKMLDVLEFAYKYVKLNRNESELLPVPVESKNLKVKNIFKKLFKLRNKEYENI